MAIQTVLTLWSEKWKQVATCPVLSFTYPDSPRDILGAGKGSANQVVRCPPWRSPQIPAVCQNGSLAAAWAVSRLASESHGSPCSPCTEGSGGPESVNPAPPRVGALTWVPGQSPHSHQGTEENKNSLWFCRLKIAPDIPVLCRETIYMLYITNHVWLQLQWAEVL